MKTAKIHLIVTVLVTLFMCAMLAFSDRTASEIALVGSIMFILNSGVPVNILLDKFIQLKGGGNG